MAKLFRQCVGKTNALVCLSIIQTLDKFTADTVCVGRFGLTAQCFVSGRQPGGQASCELSIQLWTNNMKLYLTSP